VTVIGRCLGVVRRVAAESSEGRNRLTTEECLWLLCRARLVQGRLYDGAVTVLERRRIMRSRALFSILGLVIASFAANAETVRFTPTEGTQTYAVRKPVLTIKAGDTLESSTLYSDFFTEKDGPWPGEVGPIYVEGATPEDTLVVKIVTIRPNAPTGRSGTSQNFGTLTATKTNPMLHEDVPFKIFIWKIDAERMTATLDLPGSRMSSIEVALAPMLGRLAVAPSGDQSIAGSVPYDFGGNLDVSDVREGATVYLPIFHEGAYLYFGDVHALQGDGEITGSGIETSADVTLQVDVIKGKTVDWPRRAPHGRGLAAPADRRLPARPRGDDPLARDRLRFRPVGGAPAPVPGRFRPRRPGGRPQLHGRGEVPDEVPAGHDGGIATKRYNEEWESPISTCHARWF